MKIYIKNMVCDRCVMAVRGELEREGLLYKNIQLGEVELSVEPSRAQLEILAEHLDGMGFTLLDDKKAQIVEKVKNIIIELVHRSETDQNIKLSVLLEEKLHLDYHFITTLFSSIEGMTIERFTILQRVERAKELLKYNELSLSQIAEQMGYSSVQHLSQQFKKVTGLTPSQFLSLKGNKRKPLDKLSR